MCFSAPASFMAAGVTGAIGIACLAKARSPREWPLAAIPVLFAAQQFIEGQLWLTLPVASQVAQASLLTLLFLIYAKVFWPIYAPLTALLIEPDARRRELMRVVFLAGVAVGVYLLHAVLSAEHEAVILGGHIVYETQAALPLSIVVMYMLVTCGAPLLSSHVTVRVLACTVITGALITYVFYWQAFTSVWCFFAAAASVVIFLHFVQQERMQAMPGAG